MKIHYAPIGNETPANNEAELLEGFLNRPAQRLILEAEASKGDVPVQELVHKSIEEALQRRVRYQAARELMRQWVEEGDEEEQKETLHALKRGLNESRSPDRAIFP